MPSAACPPTPSRPGPTPASATLLLRKLKPKHRPLPTVSPSSLFGLKNVAQAAPLWHLGAPQTLGWCLKESDCLIPLHRELAQISSGPTPARCGLQLGDLSGPGPGPGPSPLPSPSPSLPSPLTPTSASLPPRFLPPRAAALQLSPALTSRQVSGD